MLSALTFVASLVILGNPRSVYIRRAATVGAVLGAYDVCVALWVASRTGYPWASSFSYSMIGLMIAVVATAGFVLAGEAGLPGLWSSSRKARNSVQIAGGALIGLILGTIHWVPLLKAVPDLPAVMEARAGGPIGAACLSLRSLLADDVMYRVLVLVGLLGIAKAVLPDSGRWAAMAPVAAALLVTSLVMRWDPAHRTLLAGVSAAVYGLVYLRWGPLSLLASRLAIVALAWPLARYLVHLGW